MTKIGPDTVIRHQPRVPPVTPVQVVVGPAGPPGGSDAAQAGWINDSASATRAALSATIAAEAVPKWKANTAYAAGARVVNPSGDIVLAKVAFTSGATYDPANWTLPGTYARKASVDVRDHGAVGDGVADDTAAIQAALNAGGGSAAVDPSGSVVVLPAGSYRITATLVVPTKTVLRGVGRSSSRIVCASSGFTGSHGVDLGGTEIAFGTRCEDLTVDCNDNAAITVGIYSERINEQSGLHRCVATNFVGTGISIVNTGAGQQAQNFSLFDIETIMSTAATAASVGLDISLGGANCYGLRNYTSVIKGTGIVAGAVGIKLNGVGGQWSGLHLEGTSTGILVGAASACAGAVIEGVTGGIGMTDVVQIANNASNQHISVLGVRKSGATNSINDLLNTFTITGNCGYYIIGSGSGTAIPVITSDSAVTQRLINLFVRKVLSLNLTALGSKTTDFAIDATAGNIFTVVLGASGLNVTVTGGTQGQEITVAVGQDATGTRTLASWPSSFKFAGGVNPTLTTTPSRWDTFRFFYTGSAWREVSRAMGSN